jgi:1-acyl-sn-glycerol-3-phosphate acyltransferase
MFRDFDETTMKNTDWHYEGAKDGGLSLVERLKACPREPDPLIQAARLMAALAIRAALKTYNRFEIVGRRHLPRQGSFVLVANHASHMDAVALLSALPLKTLHAAYPLAARDYFSANRLRLCLTSVIANLMLFDRDSRGLETLKQWRQMLGEGSHILIMFPEGCRSPDGRIGRFRRGAGLLLAGTPYPVLPCYLEGTFRAWRKGSLIPRPASVRLVIGEARTYEQVVPDDPGALSVCADLHSAVLALATPTRQQSGLPISQELYP